MCFFVNIKYKCGHEYTVLRPYGNIGGHPRCYEIQDGQTVSGHWETTDEKADLGDEEHDCIECCFNETFEEWDDIQLMITEYDHTKSLQNPQIGQWVKMNQKEAETKAAVPVETSVSSAAASNTPLPRILVRIATRTVGTHRIKSKSAPN